MAIAVLAVLALAPAASATKYVDSFFGNAAGTGSAGGQFNNPRGIAVNNTTGAAYVADTSNNRIQQFDAAGAFVRAWGKDVVTSGPGQADDQQLLTVNATAGQFKLTFGAGGPGVSQTADIEWNAPATGAGSVQAALEGITNVGAGNVTVSGGPGGPGGTTPYLVTFVGARADVDQANLGVAAGTTPLTGTTTVVEVNKGATGFEVCSAGADTCKAGSSTGGAGGTFNFSSGRGYLGVNQSSGDVYVADGSNLRVQQFTAAGQFIRAWGKDVIVTGAPNDVSTTAFERCDTTAGNFINQCKAGVSGGEAGSFASNFEGVPAVVPAGAPNAGNVLVADTGNRRMQEFTATGTFVRTFGWDVAQSGPGNTGVAFEVCVVANGDVCQAGAAGLGLGQFNSGEPKKIAVDATGAVYAVGVDTGLAPSRRVQKFTPQGGSPGLAPSLFADTITGVSGAFLFPPLDVAVDPANNHVFVAKSFQQGKAAVQSCPDGSETPFSEIEVLELTASGALLDAHGACAGFSSPNVLALAFRPITGRLYITSSLSGHRVYVLDDNGITPASATVNPATGVTSTTANLSGSVNPNSVDNSFAPTTWRLQYSRNGVNWTTSSTGSLAAGTTPQAIAGTAVNLLPNTLYRTRIATFKPFGNPEISSAEGTFLTDAVPPEVAAVHADSVDATSARLTAQVNPNSTPTSYRFEWGEGNAFDHVNPLPDAPIGSGPSFVFVAEQLSGLQPGTTYRFRLVATSSTEGASTSAVRSFTTLAAPAAAGNRAYELVSPADKFGGVGVGAWYKGPVTFSGAGFAAHQGERFAVSSNLGAMLLDSPQAYANDWAFAQREGGVVGWQSHSPISHPATGGAFAQSLIPRVTTPDLSRIAWATNNTTPMIFPEMEANFSAWKTFLSPALSDWGSSSSPARWEFLGPQALSQVGPGVSAAPGQSDQTLWDIGISADGSYAVGVTNLEDDLSPRLPLVRGLAGPGDPTAATWSDLVSGRSVYLADLSTGLTDSFAIGARDLVNVCTGIAGVDRTEIPSATAGGDLASQECAGALPGRDSRLVSPYGATLKAGDAYADGANDGTLGNVVSADGSRVFFLSPDPRATGVPNGTDGCTGTSAATLCPTQLYVRQRNADGSFTIRWISKAAPGLFGSQDASLTGTVRFEGASRDGDKVFFRANSPLTADDPNGGCGAPCTTGTPSASSWDLYMYDLPDGAGADPAGGALTRVSAGPTGASDCNSPQDGSASNSGAKAAVRFLSVDGARVYFVCAAPLAGVSAPTDGTVTAPAGTQSTTNATNLYVYDAGEPLATRWHFLARIPSSSSQVDACASTGANLGSPLGGKNLQEATLKFNVQPVNCVRGSSDGDFITFWTRGRLTADDPPTPESADVYGYDADSDQLMRLTASQGGAGGTYPCGTIEPAASLACNGDGGFDYLETDPRYPSPSLGVATDPLIPGDRIAFFQSKSRLVPEDTDDAYDVYQWRNGDLSLISTGHSPTDGAVYKGNDATGRDVYFGTRDDLSWQDTDIEGDIYTARIGGGIPEPVASPLCDVLAGACEGVSAAAVSGGGTAPATLAASSGNVAAAPKARCGAGKVRRKGRCVKKKASKRPEHHGRRAAR